MEAAAGTFVQLRSALLDASASDVVSLARCARAGEHYRYALCDTAYMELTDARYRHIAPHLPTPRGNARLDNRQVLNAILYVAEHGCKWRGLPKRFGNWHTVYTRMNRWAKMGSWIVSLPSYNTRRSSE